MRIYTYAKKIGGIVTAPLIVVNFFLTNVCLESGMGFQPMQARPGWPCYKGCFYHSGVIFSSISPGPGVRADKMSQFYFPISGFGIWKVPLVRQSVHINLNFSTELLETELVF